jgi:uncharacterized protein YegL
VANNSVVGTASEISGILSTVTGVAVEIEKLIGATGVAGQFDATQVEQLTQLFSGLAQVAIKAAHDALGQEITPESVLKLMPVAIPTAPPV